MVVTFFIVIVSKQKTMKMEITTKSFAENFNISR